MASVYAQMTCETFFKRAKSTVLAVLVSGRQQNDNGSLAGSKMSSALLPYMEDFWPGLTKGSTITTIDMIFYTAGLVHSKQNCRKPEQSAFHMKAFVK